MNVLVLTPGPSIIELNTPDPRRKNIIKYVTATIRANWPVFGSIGYPQNIFYK
jgi:hypothetical protein